MKKENSEMFKSYDIRTKEGKLTAKLKERLANALAVYFKDKIKVKSVVVCRDTRLYVAELSEIVTDKLTEAGINVYLNPIPVSTCQFYFTCMQHKNSAGLMFTASHNPMEYVGIKLLAPGLIPISMENGPEGGLATVKKLYLENVNAEKTQKPGKTTVVNELENYIDYSMKLAGVTEGSLKGMKFLFEFLNGSAGFEEALAFQKAGATVTLRHVIPNGFFPCGDPNPIYEPSISPTRQAMKNGNFDLGFCFDGDGDRVDIMDSEGQQIVPSHNMSIIAPYIQKEVFHGKKDGVFCDIKTLPSSLIELAKAGIKTQGIRNGHSFIKAKLKEFFKNGYFAGAEESAHYYMSFPYDINGKNDKTSDFAFTESSLFFALLTARSCKENPKLYKHQKEEVFREREWAVLLDQCKKSPEEIFREIKKSFTDMGATIIENMDDGTSLDATLIRFNLPQTFTENTTFDGKRWFQIVLRISRSEDSILRIEVCSNVKSYCKALKNQINSIVFSCQP